MKNLTFITGNKNKVKIISEFLGYKIKHKDLDVDEIQSLDLDEVVAKKAKEAYRMVKSPVLVEDVSLVFSAFGNLPGPYIKWFLKDLGPTGCCRILNHYKKDRSAIGTLAFCYFDGKTLKIFKAKRVGRIAPYPKGNKGFGWDPIFIEQGQKLTWGEMEPKDAGATKMRKDALQRLEQYLRT